MSAINAKPEHVEEVYDRVAGDYDDLWSQHVAEPNAKLTRGLGVTRGDRVADLACGTGVFTLDMAAPAVPGETVGVDCSAGMLAAARDRARTQGLPLTLVHAKAEDFIETAHTASFDAVSLRFALAYIDWREVLPRMGRMVRRGGRVGVLTSLTSSIPQAWELYRRFMESFGAEPSVNVTVPQTGDDVAVLLEKGGLTVRDIWNFRIRLWFETGEQAAHWMVASGYATHPALGPVTEEGMVAVKQIFAAGIEDFREREGIPLDLVTSGIIAVRR